MMKTAQKLRSLLADPGILVSTTAHDALSARIIERAGFELIFHTGYGTAATRLGMPDLGLLTMTESVDAVSSIARSVRVPVIADADTGYGGLVNVERTVKEMERAGAAGMIIEDQQWPKRCGHMEGKEVIPVDEQIEKLHVAIESREDPDFVLVARTDSKALYGLDDALTRIKLYEEAGADMVFVDALESRTEMKAVPHAVRKPAMITFIPGGKTSRLTKAEVEELGYKMFVLALIPLYAAASAMVDACGQIFQGNPGGKGFPRLTFREFNSLIGIDAYQKLVKTQP